MRHLGVVGLDDQRQAELERICRPLGVEVVRILDLGDVRYAVNYHLPSLLEQAHLQTAGADLDGLTTYWDFPSSCVTAMIASDLGLPGPSLRAVVSFEHKYGSRLLQRKVAPDDTPEFVAVDVFDGDDREPPLPYPFWLKPVKSYSGHLGFRVDSLDTYRTAREQLRAGIGRLGDPFQLVLDQVEDLPDGIARTGGSTAIAEAPIDGDQCTLEGSVLHGRVTVHGVFDIHRGPDGSTFTHYRYPSRLPRSARDRMATIATDLVHAAGFDDGAFNIEFFVDAEAGRTWILEVNPRVSQEHHHLMEWVDGTSNLEVMVAVAVGDEPTLRSGRGVADVAIKAFVRRHSDAIVTRAPDACQIAEVEARHAPCAVELLVRAGDRLSELADQEPTSYIVANVHLAGSDEREVLDRQAAIVADLGLAFDEPPPSSA